MGKSVVGLDISSTSLRAVEVSSATKGKQTLMRFHEVALPEGAVDRGEVIEVHTVSSALKQLWSKGGFKSKNVVLGLGNQKVLARDLTVPKMSLSRIRESLPFQVQDLLPVPVADALLDFYPISESTSENGPTVTGLLIAAVKQTVAANVRAAQLAGLTPVEVDLIPFALCRALLTRAHAEGTAAIIDIGGNTTTVLIASNGVPQFVRIIPTGGDDLTQAIVDKLEVTSEEAEKSKRDVGLASSVSSVQEQHLVEVIYQVSTELLNSLRNTVNYFANTHPADPVHQLVLTGGGAQLPGFAEALGEMTKIPVVQADPFTGVGISHSLSADSLRHARTAMTVALGLAMRSNA